LPKSTGYEHERPPDGEGFLSLLADDRTVALMEALCDGPLERVELERRLGYGGKALGNRLSRLEEMGVLSSRPLRHDGRRRESLLSARGRELFEIGAELALLVDVVGAERAEARASLAKSFADPWDRAIVRVLVGGPQSFNGLRRALQGLDHAGVGAPPRQADAGGLSRRLRRLEQLGLVGRMPASRRGAALYALGKDAWRLGRVSALAARWRWRWTTPGKAPRLAGDLLGLAKLVAERVHVAAGAGEGVVVLHVRAPQGMEGWADVVVAVAGKRISVLHVPVGGPSARIQAFPDGWCEALLWGDLEGVEIEGDVRLARELLQGLANVLRH
jgi:DNA-binding HxlR family transcriptional regulator